MSPNSSFIFCLCFLHLLTQVAGFAARGGNLGANNPRQRFGAELADPYANSDEVARPHVDAALRVICNVRMLYFSFSLFSYS